MADTPVTKASGWKRHALGVGTLAGRALDLGRDVALAALFRPHETDAFFVAFTLPSALRHLLGEGAVAATVTPTLSKKLAREGEPAAIAFFNRARGVLAGALLLATVAGILFAGPLTDLVAAGYRARPGEFERTVFLTQTLFPFLFLSGTAAVGMAALEVRGRYGFTVVAPILLNVALLAAILALPHFLDARGTDPTLAIAVGTIAGAILQVALQLYLVKRSGWRGSAVIELKNPDVRLLAKRFLPLAAGMAFYYVDLVLSRRFLAELEAGAQSWFSWAMRICEATQALLLIAGVMPRPAEPAEGWTPSELARSSGAAVRVTLFAAVPASVVLVALSQPIVVAIFQHGEFDANSSVQTARALIWQGGGLWALVAARPLVRAFFALRDHRTPLIVGAVGVAVFVGLALVLKQKDVLGHPGISAAGAGSSLVQLLLLVGLLRARLPALPIRKIAVAAVRSFLLALPVAAGAASGALLVAPPGPAGLLLRLLPAFVGLLVFVAGFLGLSRGLRVPELMSVLAARREGQSP